MAILSTFDQYLHSVASIFNVWNQPVVFIGRPLGSCLNLHVLDRWNELINDEMLEPDLTGKLPDAVHEILTLAMNYLRNVIKLILGHPESCLNAQRLLVNFFQLLLLR